MSKHVLIVAGDPSGDQHAAALVQALRARSPSLKVSALGGTRLRGVADQFLFPLVGVGGFGFWEPLIKLPELYRARQQVKSLLEAERPDAVIPVDYYGFNIHIARLAHARGIPVVYYISPQVWASRPHRIQELKKVVSRMLVFFPFEADLYRKTGLPATLVGHPLIDQLPEPSEPDQNLTLGLLPGSRPSVVRRHLPILIGAAQELRANQPDLRALVFRSENIEPGFYEPFLKAAPWIELTYDPQYARRGKITLAIGVSGTAALENMLLGIPMVVMYRLSTLSYWIARRLIRIPYVSIPNILANKAVVPELLQGEATPRNLADAARKFIDDRSSWQSMRETLLSLRGLMKGGPSSQRAAEEITKVWEKSVEPLTLNPSPRGEQGGRRPGEGLLQVR